jgi:hypothetical protein
MSDNAYPVRPCRRVREEEGKEQFRDDRIRHLYNLHGRFFVLRLFGTQKMNKKAANKALQSTPASGTPPPGQEARQP